MMTPYRLEVRLLALLGAGCTIQPTTSAPLEAPMMVDEAVPSAPDVDESLQVGDLEVLDAPEIWGRVRVQMTDLPVGKEVVLVASTEPGNGRVDGTTVDLQDPRVIALFTPEDTTRNARGKHGTDAIIDDELYLQAVALDGSWKTPVITSTVTMFPSSCAETPVMGYAYTPTIGWGGIDTVTFCDTTAVPGLCLPEEALAPIEDVVNTLIQTPQGGVVLPTEPACFEPEAIDSCCYTFSVMILPSFDTGDWRDPGTGGWGGGGGGWGGRPFRVDDSLRVGEVEFTGSAVAAADCPDELRQGIVEGWIRAGLEEHASVAAFARFSLELLHLGAPLELVERASAAQLDEVRHTRLAFAIASRFAGETIRPRTLPVEQVRADRSLREVVLDVVREGCLNETVSTVQAMLARDATVDTAIHDTLSTIVDDESRHAELSWAFVRWALQQPDTSDLRAEVLAELRAFAPAAVAMSDEPVQAFGVMTPSLRHAAAARAKTLIGGCTEALAACT